MSLPDWLEMIRSQAIAIEVDLKSARINHIFEGKLFGIDRRWLVVLRLNYDDNLVQVELHDRECSPDLGINAILQAKADAALLDAAQYIQVHSWTKICKAIGSQYEEAKKLLNGQDIKVELERGKHEDKA